MFLGGVRGKVADPQSYRPATGTIPTSPGVYKFRDENGRVIYVGKAKNLRQRLNNYFQNPADLHPRTRTMVFTGASVEWTVVGSEVEALQLEYTWIKKFDPRFNVMYRDDKTYPMLAVSTGEKIPRAFFYRGPRRKNVRYFGPYSHAWAVRESLELLTRVFPMRTCTKAVYNRHERQGRPCLPHRQVFRAVYRAGEPRRAPRDRQPGRLLLKRQHGPGAPPRGEGDARGRRGAQL